MPVIQKRFLLLGVAFLILLIASAVLYFKVFKSNELATDTSTDTQIVGEASDVVDEFYDAWHAAQASGTIDALVGGLSSSTLVSAEVQTYISEAMKNPDKSVDPVLCQATLPERFGFKISYEQERAAQYLVLARGGEVKSPNVAVVDLGVVNNAWQITKITCSSGETGPEREYTFEREGFLLKSVPAPLDSNYWHLVFEEQGQMGHTVQLSLGPESICVYTDAREAVCDPSTFVDATPVTLRGNMTDTTVEVKRIIFKN